MAKHQVEILPIVDEHGNLVHTLTVTSLLLLLDCKTFDKSWCMLCALCLACARSPACSTVSAGKQL